jgi:serine/threonine-protein kinase
VAPPTTGTLYVSNGNAVTEFPAGTRNAQPSGTITAGIDEPYGLYVDTSGNLYVANKGNGSVTEYPPAATQPSITYVPKVPLPHFVAVDGAGNIFVTASESPVIDEFTPGTTTPAATLNLPGYEGDGLDLDAAGDLFVAYRSVKGGRIAEFAAGSTKAEDLGISIGLPEGLVVDGVGNIIVVDTTNTVVDIFPPGATSPSRQIMQTKTPSAVALSTTQSRLYITTLRAAVRVLDYPSGTAHLWLSDVAAPVQGIAVDPPRPPKTR